MDGIFIRSMVVEGEITISKTFIWRISSCISNYKPSQLPFVFFNVIVNAVDPDMPLGNVQQRLREHSVGMSCHSLFKMQR